MTLTAQAWLSFWFAALAVPLCLCLAWANWHEGPRWRRLLVPVFVVLAALNTLVVVFWLTQSSLIFPLHVANPCKPDGSNMPCDLAPGAAIVLPMAVPCGLELRAAICRDAMQAAQPGTFRNRFARRPAGSFTARCFMEAANPWTHHPVCCGKVVCRYRTHLATQRECFVARRGAFAVTRYREHLRQKIKEAIR